MEYKVDWKPCEDVLADEGYPSDEETWTVAHWPINGSKDVIAAFEYVRQRWSYPDYWNQDRKIDNGKIARIYTFSTGGWSGNEMLVDAMQRNDFLWMLSWYSIRRGGHYEFRVSE